MVGIKKFSSENFLITIAVIVKLILQLIATANSGYHGDELLHIEAGRHLAFGYMDFPPVISFLAWIQNFFQSDSLYINHLFNYINSILIVILSGLLTIQIGGKHWAVLITMLCLLFSPGFGASQYLFLPTAFEQIFWLGFIYCIVNYSITGNARNIIFAGIVAAFGFLNKYGILFLFGGFVISLVFFKRELLKQKQTYIALILFILLISPNLFWQIQNGFPVFGHFSELYKTQLDKHSFADEMLTLVLFLNPLAFPVWATALAILPFTKKFRDYRLPLFTMFIAFSLLVLAKGKSYYFAPLVLGLIPFGAVYFEQLFEKRKLFLKIYLPMAAIAGMVLLPHGIPVLKLNTYLNTFNLKPNKDNKIPLMFENYYANENWKRILPAVNKTYSNLSDKDKKNCLIWGRHYSMAGGINLMGAKYHLPEAFSFHSSFYSWVPEFSKDVVVIAISESNWDKVLWEQYFSEVEEIQVVENKYASEPNWYNYRIFLCKKAKYDSVRLKKLFEKEIF
ncbi:MAG: glycosyltransferase family 39 protein [Bacteroidales bacterium]